MNKLATLALIFAAGCGIYSTDVTPKLGAPKLAARAAPATVVHDAAPAGAVELATLTVQQNNWSSSVDCEKHLADEAAKLGGDTVLAAALAGGIGQGPKCSGVVYAAKP